MTNAQYIGAGCANLCYLPLSLEVDSVGLSCLQAWKYVYNHEGDQVNYWQQGKKREFLVLVVVWLFMVCQSQQSVIVIRFRVASGLCQLSRVQTLATAQPLFRL